MIGKRRPERGGDAVPRATLLLVVVGDFNFVCIALLPAKAHTILVIDANTILATTVTPEYLQAIARTDC